MAEKRVDYNQKEPEELAKILAEKEKELLEARISAAQRKTKDVHVPTKIRREIARVAGARQAKKLRI